MNKNYWTIALVAMLVMLLGTGCTAFKPAKTIIQDAEEVQILELQTESTVFETETEKSAGSDLAITPSNEADTTEADGLTDGASDQMQSEMPDQAIPAAVSSSEGTGATSAPADVDAVNSVEVETASTAKAETSTPTLITKSENAVTEAERIELFNTLGFELDELIRLLDSLDTVQESDLNLDEFEE